VQAWLLRITDLEVRQKLQHPVPCVRRAEHRARLCRCCSRRAELEAQELAHTRLCVDVKQDRQLQVRQQATACTLPHSWHVSLCAGRSWSAGSSCSSRRAKPAWRASCAACSMMSRAAAAPQSLTRS